MEFGSGKLEILLWVAKSKKIEKVKGKMGLAIYVCKPSNINVILNDCNSVSLFSIK